MSYQDFALPHLNPIVNNAKLLLMLGLSKEDALSRAMEISQQTVNDALSRAKGYESMTTEQVAQWQDLNFVLRDLRNNFISPDGLNVREYCLNNI